jgi:hypothetical protein
MAVMTSAERQRLYSARRAAEGIAQFKTWLPIAQHAELYRLIDMLKSNPEMRVASVALQNQETGRMHGVKLR